MYACSHYFFKCMHMKQGEVIKAFKYITPLESFTTPITRLFQIMCIFQNLMMFTLQINNMYFHTSTVLLKKVHIISIIKSKYFLINM